MSSGNYDDVSSLYLLSSLSAVYVGSIGGSESQDSGSGIRSGVGFGFGSRFGSGLDEKSHVILQENVHLIREIEVILIEASKAYDKMEYSSHVKETCAYIQSFSSNMHGFRWEKSPNSEKTTSSSSLPLNPIEEVIQSICFFMISSIDSGPDSTNTPQLSSTSLTVDNMVSVIYYVYNEYEREKIVNSHDIVPLDFLVVILFHNGSD
jgi:hypothetical protein